MPRVGPCRKVWLPSRLTGVPIKTVLPTLDDRSTPIPAASAPLVRLLRVVAVEGARDAGRLGGPLDLHGEVDGDLDAVAGHVLDASRPCRAGGSGCPPAPGSGSAACPGRSSPPSRCPARRAAPRTTGRAARRSGSRARWARRRGPSAARSTSTWIHWWSSVASAKVFTRPWVISSQPVVPRSLPARARSPSRPWTTVVVPSDGVGVVIVVVMSWSSLSVRNPARAWP